MSWCAGCLTCRLPNLMRSPPARSLVSSITVDWFLAPRRWGFYLKSKSTNYPDHGHHGNPPPTRKIPMAEPGIEPGTSWLVARISDHQTTRLVAVYMNSVSTSGTGNFHGHILWYRSHICLLWCVVCNDEHILIDLVCRCLFHFSNPYGVVATSLDDYER